MELLMEMSFVLHAIAKWRFMMRYFKFSMILCFLFVCSSQDSFARGCNKPQRICNMKSGSEVCYWKDDNSCRYCSRKKCNANLGCKWSGFLLKKCASDFSTGTDGPI